MLKHCEFQYKFESTHTNKCKFELKLHCQKESLWLLYPYQSKNCSNVKIKFSAKGRLGIWCEESMACEKIKLAVHGLAIEVANGVWKFFIWCLC